MGSCAQEVGGLKNMSLPRVIASSTTLPRKILLSPTCVTSGINIPVSRLPSFTSYVRSVSLSHKLLGPGADHKYRSQEEKDEKLKSENKKKKVLMMGWLWVVLPEDCWDIIITRR